jgi:very-short-patch-repair endonuclease
MSLRRSLRNRSTSAEATLWGILKSKKLDGRKFRRQHGIGYYIVDFCCPAEKLVIELDGDQHGDHEQIEKDKKRDKYLEGARTWFYCTKIREQVCFSGSGLHNRGDKEDI